MNKKCPNCELNNFSGAASCVRCRFLLTGVVSSSSAGVRQAEVRSVYRRITVCFAICLLVVPCFYGSLIVSSKSLSGEETGRIERSIRILEKSGFVSEAHYLRRFAYFRASDNWLNSLVAKENAYAATNYPFGVITVYPDFFAYAQDDTERAAILLHEAKHLQGADEKEAYTFVWENRRYLGWTNDKYHESVLWRNVRRQTREYAPRLFICNFNEFDDCTDRD